MEKKKKQEKLLLIFLIFYYQPTLTSLLSGTLVKKPKGLTPVETLKVGDILIGYLEENSLINVCVLDITSNIIETGIIIKTTNGEICTVADELFYDPIHNQYDVEAFDKGGKHLGSYDPETLQLYKSAKPNYIIEVN